MQILGVLQALLIDRLLFDHLDPLRFTLGALVNLLFTVVFLLKDVNPLMKTEHRVCLSLWMLCHTHESPTQLSDTHT